MTLPIPHDIFITTPIYYINDRPHIGHLYTSAAADILARYHRLLGAHVFLSTGTDEHGSKVARAAQEKNEDPQTYVDHMVGHFQHLVDKAHVQYDDFVRTTESRHHACATALWERLQASGAIYKGHYAGWYALRDEAYYEESELIDGPQGRCAPTGAPVEWVQEDCFFFRLSQWQEPLLAYYRQNPQAIGPEHRLNEVMSFIERGLHDFAVSRTNVTWGIPVPQEPGHVMYVWIDALANYLTVLGYPNTSSPLFERFWPHCLHLLGKDILRFHAIYWPALLMALGLPLPQRLFAHGWWMIEGQKMSKSLGNVIDPNALIDTYGVDPVRYFLARHVRFGQDGDFQFRLLDQTYDSELVNGMGNLAHRVLTFIQSKWNGHIPSFHHNLQDESTHSVMHWGISHLGHAHHCIEQQDLLGYLELINHGIAHGNSYMSAQAPWRSFPQPMHSQDEAAHHEALARAENTLYALVILLRDLALLMWPVMPSTAEKLWLMLGYDQPINPMAVPGVGALVAKESWCSSVHQPWLGGGLKQGLTLPAPQPLFTKRER